VGESANLERLSCHGTGPGNQRGRESQSQNVPVNHIGVSDNGGQLGITISALRPFVYIGATDNSQTIVDDANFGMDVNLQALEGSRCIAGELLLAQR
jgi:hypothetical protein